MAATLLISFREFLEAFLIIGVFLGLSRSLNLKKEKEIIGASLLGIGISLVLPVAAYLLGDRVKAVLTEEKMEILEGYLMVFSGFFIAYVVLSLHKFFAARRDLSIAQARKSMTAGTFDAALFGMILLFIVREGFEVALFTGTTSLLTSLSENMAGLALGFAFSGLASLAIFLLYTKFPIGKIFRATEYLIVFLGAAFIKNGLSEMLEIHFNVNLADMLPLHLAFLPDKEGMFGHALNSILGIERGLSLAHVALMLAYGLGIYLLLMRDQKSYSSANRK